MSCSSENLPATKAGFSPDQKREPSEEAGSIAGRRVRVKSERSGTGSAGDIKELEWHKAVHPVLSKVAVFATEKDYSQMHVISSEVKKKVSGAKNERLKEVWGVDLPFKLSPKDYRLIVRHKESILKKIGAPSLQTSISHIIRVAEGWAKFNIEKATNYLGKAGQDKLNLKLVDSIGDTIQIAKAQARLGLREEAANLLRKVLVSIEIACKKLLCDRFSCNCKTEELESMLFLFNAFVKAREEIDPNIEIADSTRKAQKRLQSIKSKFPLILYRIDGYHINMYIKFLVKRWEANPEEAADEIMYKIIKEIEEPTKKIVMNLSLIIASVQAKIKPNQASNDLERAYELTKLLINPGLKFGFLEKIVKMGLLQNPEVAREAFKESYELFADHKPRTLFLKSIREIDLAGASTIPSEIMVKDVQHPYHKALILTWIAERQAIIHPKKAIEIFNDVLEIIKGLAGDEKDEIRLYLAMGISEINPSKAYEIAGQVNNFEDIKAEALIKIARMMMKQAGTKKDLNQAAKIFKEAEALITSRDLPDETLLMDLFDFSIPILDEPIAFSQHS